VLRGCHPFQLGRAELFAPGVSPHPPFSGASGCLQVQGPPVAAVAITFCPSPLAITTLPTELCEHDKSKLRCSSSPRLSQLYVEISYEFFFLDILLMAWLRLIPSPFASPSTALSKRSSVGADFLGVWPCQTWHFYHTLFLSLLSRVLFLFAPVFPRPMTLLYSPLLTNYGGAASLSVFVFFFFVFLLFFFFFSCFFFFFFVFFVFYLLCFTAVDAKASFPF